MHHPDENALVEPKTAESTAPQTDRRGNSFDDAASLLVSPQQQELLSSAKLPALSVSRLSLLTSYLFIIILLELRKKRTE